MTRALVAAAACLAAACAAPHRGPAPLRVGTSGDYPPFSVRVDDSWQGLDIEVARRFAADTGRPLEIVEFRWPGLELDLAAGRFDVAMAGVTMRPWRERVGAFTRPVAHAGAMILLDPDAATTLAQLDAPEHRVGVNAGGHLERVARRLLPHAAVVPVPSNLMLPGLLGEHRVDAVMTDELEAPFFRSQVTAALTIGPLTRDRKAYLARDPALAAELDTWLRAREADGWLPAVRTHFLGPQWAEPRGAAGSDLDALLAFVDLRLAFMPSVAAAKDARGLPTVDAAQENLVRAHARERATLLGVSPERIDALFVAQIATGRHVQDAWRATPAADRPPVEQMDLDGEVRPALMRVSDTIVARAADLAREWTGPRPTAAAIAEALDPSLAPIDDRLAIAAAIVAIVPAAHE